jgi:hypothetical protein
VRYVKIAARAAWWTIVVMVCGGGNIAWFGIMAMYAWRADWGELAVMFWITMSLVVAVIYLDEMRPKPYVRD